VVSLVYWAAIFAATSNNARFLEALLMCVMVRKAKTGPVALIPEQRSISPVWGLVIDHPSWHSPRSAHLAQWVQPQVCSSLPLPPGPISALCCLAFIGAPGFHHLLRRACDSNNQTMVRYSVAYNRIMR
jgi:hypothetical protein